MVHFRAILLSCLTLGASLAFAQDKALTIGDPAPDFKPVGWVKGSPLKKFEKGKVYVVEFWATWCGPCIASFPHLSEMADKMKGKVDFISVNTWDRNEAGEKEPGNKAHDERVAKFVKENDAKMRYNIALDDEKDTISTTWMRAAGRNGIPCAFIVNGDGVVAWIGHPMQMEKPLEEVYAKTWDLKAFRESFEKEAAKAREQMKLSKDLGDAAKAGNRAEFDSLIKKITGPPAQVFSTAFGAAVRQNPEFAMKYLEENIGKVQGIEPYGWCSMLGMIVSSSKDNAIRDKAIALSADCVKMTPEKTAALSNAYHARLLMQAGKKDEARDFVVKARAAVAKYEPAEGRESLNKFIDSIEKQLGA